MSQRKKGVFWLVAALFSLGLAGVGNGAGAVVPAALAVIGVVMLFKRGSEVSAQHQFEQFRATKWQEFQQTEQAWHDAIVREESFAMQKLDAAPRWYPLERIELSRRLDVVGGSPAGWATLIRTGLSPLVAGGAGITVLDLSGRSLAETLWVQTGADVPLSTASFPSGVRDADPLLGTARPADVVAAIHLSESASDDSGRRDIEASIIRRLTNVLGSNVTLPRLVAALDSLLTGGSHGVTSELTSDEQNKLQDPDFFGRLGPDGHSHLSRLAAALDGLMPNGVEDAGFQSGTTAALPAFHESGIAMIRADSTNSAAARRRIANLLVASLMDRLDRTSRSPGFLLIVGADSIAGQLLEDLSATAEDHGLKLIMFFEHLRRDIREMLGRGHSDTVFMRLGNVDDATAAAQFIGKEFQFVVSSLSMQVGATLGGGEGWGPTQTFGENQSQTRQNAGGDSSTWGTSWSMAVNRNYSSNWSDTTTYGETSTRSEEFAARAEDLQRIPTTGFIYVTRVGGRQHTVAGDCHPAIASSRFVASRPIARG